MGLIGTIIGDIAGSQYEFGKPEKFNCRTAPLFTEGSDFTDDTVLAIATKYAIDNQISFTKAYQKFAREYPGRGYGGNFYEWIYSDNPRPYNSYGNGSAMRVAYVADFYSTEKEVLDVARESAIVTHNHPEGIKGAQATAMCSYMARTGANKFEIRKYIVDQYGDYYFKTPVNRIFRKYNWNEICQDSVPLAVRCFLDSEDYVDFLRKVLFFDCDADTICAIGGCIAENYYKTIGLSTSLILNTYLDQNLLAIINEGSCSEKDN